MHNMGTHDTGQATRDAHHGDTRHGAGNTLCTTWGHMPRGRQHVMHNITQHGGTLLDPPAATPFQVPLHAVLCGCRWCPLEPHGHPEGSRGTPWPPRGVLWNPMAIQRGLVEPHGHPEGSCGTPWPPRGVSWNPFQVPLHAVLCGCKRVLVEPHCHLEGSHGTLWPPRGVSWNPVATQRSLVEPRGHPEGSRGTPWPPRGVSSRGSPFQVPLQVDTEAVSYSMATQRGIGSTQIHFESFLVFVSTNNC